MECLPAQVLNNLASTSVEITLCFAPLCATAVCVITRLCRYGKARIYVDGTELYTKRYTFLQQAWRCAHLPLCNPSSTACSDCIAYGEVAC